MLESRRRARRRFRSTWLLRLAVSAAVLIAIFRHRSDRADLATRHSDSRRCSGVRRLAIFLVGHAAAAAKWRLLIGPGVSFAQAFQAHLAGLAANLCLPGVAGGDVVRAGLVFPSAEDKAQLVVGSVADRMLDIFGLMHSRRRGRVSRVAPGPARARAASSGYSWRAVAVGVMLAFPASILLDRTLRRARIRRVASVVSPSRAVSATAYLAHRPRRLLLCLTISIAVQATFVAINIAFAAADAGRRTDRRRGSSRGRPPRSSLSRRSAWAGSACAKRPWRD